MPAITTADLTTKKINGTGVFDELMQTVVLHLNKEYSKNRIKGPDYSKLYLGALEAVLAQSIGFLIQKDTAGKQADLIAAQIVTQGLQDTLLQAQVDKLASDKALVDAQLLNVVKQGTELDAQIALLGSQNTKLTTVDTDIITAQINKIDSEKLLTDQAKLKAIQETLLTTNSAANELLKATIIPKQGAQLDAQTALENGQLTKLTTVDTDIVTAQINKLNSEKALTDQAKLKAIEETTFALHSAANELLKAAIIPKEGIKLDKEASLLQQKTDTEKAQILDTVNGLSITGVVGKQKILFTNQANGFIRDAEQKLAKIIADIYSIRISIAGQVPPEVSGIYSTDLSAILNKAEIGIGVTPPPAPPV